MGSERQTKIKNCFDPKKYKYIDIEQQTSETDFKPQNNSLITSFLSTSIPFN